MEMLPDTENSPVVRTDFENEQAWIAICEMIRRPVNDRGEDFYAYVTFIENPAFCNLSPQDLLERAPSDYRHSFFMVVDHLAMQAPEFPILIVDLYDQRGRTFRAVPSQIQGIQNNLSIANMDFQEFAESADDDGVFRGFPE